MKSAEYLCPKCKKPLRVNKHIILLAEKSDRQKGLLLFEPELGDYNFLKHSSFSLKTGENLRFSCPICHADLQSAEESFSEIILKETSGEIFAVRFSGRVGEQATYKMKEGQITEHFGPDSEKYFKQ